MLKSLHIDDVKDLSPDAFFIVEDWIKFYGLPSATLISQVEPDEKNRFSVVEVWGWPMFLHIRQDLSTTFFMQPTYDVIKLAELDFDDFPWHVVPEAIEE